MVATPARLAITQEAAGSSPVAPPFVWREPAFSSLRPGRRLEILSCAAGEHSGSIWNGEKVRVDLILRRDSRFFLLTDYEPIERPIIPGRNSRGEMDARFSYCHSCAGPI